MHWKISIYLEYQKKNHHLLHTCPYPCKITSVDVYDFKYISRNYVRKYLEDFLESNTISITFQTKFQVDTRLSPLSFLRPLNN